MPGRLTKWLNHKDTKATKAITKNFEFQIYLGFVCFLCETFVFFAPSWLIYVGSTK
jgi:hypothetical protein